MKATKLTRKSARGASMLGQLAEQLAFRCPKPLSDEHAAEILDSARAQARIGLQWLAEHASEVLAELPAEVSEKLSPYSVRNGVAGMLAPDADPSPLAHWAKGTTYLTKCEWSDKGARLVGAVNRKDVATIFGADVEGYVDERAADKELLDCAACGAIDIATVVRACRAAKLVGLALRLIGPNTESTLDPSRTMRMLDEVSHRSPRLDTSNGALSLRWGTGGCLILKYHVSVQECVTLDLAKGTVEWPYLTPWRKPQAYADAAE